MELVPRPRLATRTGAPGASPQGQLPPRPSPRPAIRADELGSVRRLRLVHPRDRLGRRPFPGVPSELEGADGERLWRPGSPRAQRAQLAAAPDLADRPLAPRPARRMGGWLQYHPDQAGRRIDRGAPPCGPDPD